MEGGRSEPLDGALADGSLASSAFNDLKNLQTSSPVFLNSVDGVREISAEPREKKSSFKITRIVSRNGGNEDSDSIDDRTGENDLSSDVTDISQSTNVVANIGYDDTIYSSMEDVVTGLPPLQDEPKESVPPPPLDELKEKDVHSRFRLVKIDNQEGIRHGRWHCLDFNDSVLKSVEESRSGGGRSPRPENMCETLRNSNHASDDQTALRGNIYGDPKLFSRLPSENSSVDLIVFSDLSHGAVSLNASSLANCSPQTSAMHPLDPLSMPLDPLGIVPSLSSTPVVSMDKEHLAEGFQAEDFPLEVLPSSNSNFMENGDFMSRFQSFQFVTGNLLSNMTRKRSEASDLEMLDER